jgi:hypothetical protein
MTITQTVEIPANRRLKLDLEIPREVPIGRTNVIIQIPVNEDSQSATMPKAAANKKISMTRQELDEFLKNSHTPISDSLLGILKTDITVEEIRIARLAKHLR